MIIDRFAKGTQFPHPNDIGRIAEYMYNEQIFDGKHGETYDRIASLLRESGSPQQSQLEKLYIAVNVAQILCLKPADLMFGEPPIYSTNKPDADPAQVGLQRVVLENDLTTAGHTFVTSLGYRGDGWLRVRLDQRHDTSGLAELGLPAPQQTLEPIIESINPANVFPDVTETGGKKQFKAINVCWVEIIPQDKLFKTKERYVLHVERHLPGYIVYRDFEMTAGMVEKADNGILINTYYIGDEIPLENNIIATGVSDFLIKHVPYVAKDDDWQGSSLISQINPLLATINDTLSQISYVLAKHADPILAGTDVGGNSVSLGGKYIEVGKEDVIPQYLTWNAHLDLNFKLIDKLLAMVFQMAEIPQWVFGTTITQDGGGTGTSHTDSSAIKARFFPLLSKVNRIRNNVDKALRDTLYNAQLLEQQQARALGIDQYTVPYPTILWRDGLPRDEKYDAEVAGLRTGGKPTLDQIGAIKYLDGVNDEQAQKIIDAIGGDDERINGTVDASIFNTPEPVDNNVNDAFDDEDTEGDA